MISLKFGTRGFLESMVTNLKSKFRNSMWRIQYGVAQPGCRCSRSIGALMMQAAGFLKPSYIVTKPFRISQCFFYVKLKINVLLKLQVSTSLQISLYFANGVRHGKFAIFYFWMLNSQIHHEECKNRKKKVPSDSSKFWICHYLFSKYNLRVVTSDDNIYNYQKYHPESSYYLHFTRQYLNRHFCIYLFIFSSNS